MVSAGWHVPQPPTGRAGTPTTVQNGETVVEHDGAGADLGPLPYFDGAQDLGAGADQHAAANLGVAVAALLAGAAERHFLQDGYFVLDHRRLADDEAGAVIDHDAGTELGGGVDIDREHFGDAALQVVRRMSAVLPPEPVADAIGLQRLIAFEVEERGQQVRAGGVAVADGAQVDRSGLDDARVVLVGVGDQAGERHAVDLLVGELAGEAVGEGFPETAVAQQDVVDGARHEAVVGDGGHRIGRDRRPEAVERRGAQPVEAGGLRHGSFRRSRTAPSRWG